MTRHEVRGGWYGDVAGLTGEWAALVRGSHIETSRGRVPLCPAGNVLFLRCTVVHGVLYLAGQGHQDGAAWLWDGHTWHRAYHTTNGQKVVAFGPRGLYIASSPHSVHILSLTSGEVTALSLSPGSGGIQYVTEAGDVVLGDQTYGNGPDRWPHVAEWTDLDGHVIGQGYEGGAIIDGRVLEPGHCTFIHAYRGPAETIAVSLVTPTATVFHWLHISEIASLPLAGGTEPPPPPPDPEHPVSIPNLFHVVQRIDREHPQLINENTPETVLEFYWRTAYALHREDPKFGFLSKSAGENHQVINGQRVAVDAVAYQGSDEIVDIIQSAGDGPGTGAVSWNVDERRPSNVWVKPVPFQSGDDDDEPPPPPAGDDLKALAARIEQLGRHLGAWR